MIFAYPMIFVSHKNDKSYHVTFPDLQCCEANGPDLGDAMEHVRGAAYNWPYLEIEEKTSEFPPRTHVEGIRLEGREFLKQIMVTMKLLSDND